MKEIRIGQIEKELNSVYEEMNKWTVTSDRLSDSEIRKRELVLLKRWILYRLEDAINQKNKREELFCTEVYGKIKEYLNELEEKGY